jgi:hypothetical protein
VRQIEITDFNMFRVYFKHCNWLSTRGASAANAISRDIGIFSGRAVLINGLFDVDIFTK